MKTVGVLALHGDVAEHVAATEHAARILHRSISVRLVRTNNDLRDLDGLVIPGGESTTLQKLLEREDMVQEIKKIRAIFGTCAGAILMAREVTHTADDQRTLNLMGITIDRNAYGRQSDSFEEDIDTTLGRVRAIFIRAPRILKADSKISVLAHGRNGILACEEVSGKSYYLATSFHPELTTTIFHEHFLKQVS